MAEQALIQFGANKAQRQEVPEIYEKLGITRAQAKNAFYELRRQVADVPEMSLEEINAEISAVRAKRKG